MTLTDLLDVPPTLTPASVATLLGQLRAAEAAAPGKALVLKGSEAVFCSGMDLMALLEAPSPGDLKSAMAPFAQVLVRLCRLSRPVIAVVEARAAGGGLGLVAACDYVIAARGADFVMPEVLLGLVPGMIYPVLRRRVAVGPLNIMAIDGNARTAVEALGLGLVDEVAEPGDLPQRVKRLCRIFSRGHGPAVGIVKGLELSDSKDGLEKAIGEGMARTMELLLQPQTRARIGAMLEGQAPWLV